MTSSVVSLQGFTYEMTCVSLANCLTSGVHLNRSVTARSNWGWAFVFNKTSRGVGLLAEGHLQRVAALT
jgi:hypothetical protein